MKLIRAARFAAIVFLIGLFYGLFALSVPLDLGLDWAARSAWFAVHPVVWILGGWLGMLLIFAWMIVLVAVMYTYIPMHRISTSLQTGLMLLAAGLLIAGAVVWMRLLPRAAGPDWAAFVDHLALGLLGAGLLMAGATTIWVLLDLGRLEKLPWPWLIPGLLAGLSALPSPFLLPNRVALLSSLAFFFIWCTFLGLRRAIPPAFPEMDRDLFRK